jgi:LysR family hydrogen peroxide-inducible transcriptional activator
MNLQEFRYIAAVSSLRHFGRAAEACHVSQPTLSSQIRKLEEELGVALFERTNKRVELTPAGERILEHANRILEEAGQIEAIAKAVRDPMRGPLRLGVIPTLAPYLMPLILHSLQTDIPGSPSNCGRMEPAGSLKWCAIIAWMPHCWRRWWKSLS